MRKLLTILLLAGQTVFAQTHTDTLLSARIDVLQTQITNFSSQAADLYKRADSANVRGKRADTAIQLINTKLATFVLQMVNLQAQINSLVSGKMDSVFIDSSFTITNKVLSLSPTVKKSLLQVSKSQSDVSGIAGQLSSSASLLSILQQQITSLTNRIAALKATTVITSQ